MLPLNSYDRKILSSQEGSKIGKNELIFRIETEKSRRVGIKSFIKVNFEYEMVYFLSEKNTLNEKILFESKGTKIRYMRLNRDLLKTEILNK